MEHVPHPPERSGRARAMPPDQRRQAIVAAVLPLLTERGTDVTTRELAQAAGVAEGTLFRVFEDKAALLHAAAHSLLDPQRTRSDLAGVDPALDLDAMVQTVAQHLLETTERVMAVLMALRSTGAGSGPPRGGHGPPAFVAESARALLDGLTDLFARYRTELRVEPDRAALALRALVFGSRQPWTPSATGLTASEIAGIVLRGVRASRGQASC